MGKHEKRKKKVRYIVLRSSEISEAVPASHCKGQGLIRGSSIWEL
jgi:hypothetical protein